MSDKLEWPTFFPANCPPSDAIVATGAGYRFVKNSPPTPADFASHAEMKRRFGGDECQACGLSVFRNIEDLNAMRSRVKAFRSQYTAVGDLDTGVVKHTPASAPSHHSWWLPVDTFVHENFRVIEAEEIQS